MTVLFLVFNRPQTTTRVFEAIRRARPSKLYVAADGPRSDRQGEPERCAEVRRIATSIDWPCDVKTLFRDNNLGCRKAVSEAIDWFFQHEPEGIILEDDCIPDPSFFRYAHELLARYRNDERIMVIAAQHFHGDTHIPQHSYFFSRYNHCWGWASWRRAWQCYDHEMSLWPDLRDTDWLLGVGNGSQLFKRYWTDIFDRAHAGLIDSWAYRWTFSCWAQNGLTVLPAKNLVTNIGFGIDATHTIRHTNYSALPLESLDFPLVHPNFVVRDVMADQWTDRNHFLIRSPMSFKYTIRWIRRATRLTNLLQHV
ncbi:MAG: nucleotide-diphospho-sugar transferase [Gammaproteobacteria bacterium]|nr:nucleotide-diphospho-sugar transferase [Gammaproteobacteria bacterium]